MTVVSEKCFINSVVNEHIFDFCMNFFKLLVLFLYSFYPLLCNFTVQSTHNTHNNFTGLYKDSIPGPLSQKCATCGATPRSYLICIADMWYSYSEVTRYTVCTICTCTAWFPLHNIMKRGIYMRKSASQDCFFWHIVTKNAAMSCTVLYSMLRRYLDLKSLE